MTGIEEISSGNEIAIALNYETCDLPQCTHMRESGEVLRVVVAETDDDVARFCLDCLLEWVADHRNEIGLGKAYDVIEGTGRTYQINIDPTKISGVKNSDDLLDEMKGENDHSDSAHENDHYSE